VSPDRTRILALDLGEVRIGVALSDPLGITAQPIGFVERVGPRRDLVRIAELVREHGVGRVVIGLPLLLSGEEGAAALISREFKDGLERRTDGVPVVLWDERLTSVEAERSMIRAQVRRGRRREKIDTLAAVLILQSYLDSN